MAWPRDEDHGSQDLHELLRGVDLGLHAIDRTLVGVCQLLAPPLQLLVLLDILVRGVRDADVLRRELPDCVPHQLAVVAVRVVWQAVLRDIARLDVVHKVVVDEVGVDGTKAGDFDTLSDLTGQQIIHITAGSDEEVAADAVVGNHEARVRSEEVRERVVVVKAAAGGDGKCLHVEVLLPEMRHLHQDSCSPDRGLFKCQWFMAAYHESTVPLAASHLCRYRSARRRAQQQRKDGNP